MECLLSFIEINQYQQCIIKCIGDKIIDDEDIKYKHYDFPSSIPMSSIIEETSSNVDDDIRDFKMKAHKLYKKYIIEGCEFEINISYLDRQSLCSILDDEVFLMNNNSINICDIFKLFENVKNEMTILLQYSLSRFKKQRDFDKIIQLFS